METALEERANEEEIEAGANRVLGVINDGALALMVSLGHRVGLFDFLSDSRPVSLAEIVDGAGLDDRYVREWL